MRYDIKDVTVEKVKHAELENLEDIFTLEFGDEMNIELIQSRIRRIRQFYYLLLPLSEISPWIRSLFNIYIIKVKGEFAGFMQLSLIEKERLHLDFIAISKSHRGKGLGGYVLKGLLKHWVDERGYGVILEVRLDNPAYRLYQNLGFMTKQQILHYEREFNEAKEQRIKIAPNINFQKLQTKDRKQLYALHEISMPDSLADVLHKNPRQFRPSLFIRQLTWLKTKLMKRESHEYVLKVKESIVAKIDIKSYPRERYHVLHILLHPTYELLRIQILRKVISLLSERYTSGKISTNVYDDMISKQHDLERAAFLKTEAYFFMYRPPQRSKSSKKKYTVTSIKEMRRKRALITRGKKSQEKCKKT